MPWFKIDDSFYDHPKVFDAPDCAVALWTRAGTWSARNLTDGFVPSGMPARFCDDPERGVRELINRGLWKRTRSGYQFHDWNEYQPSADDVKSVREKRAAAGRIGGTKSGRVRAKKAGYEHVTAADIHRPDGATENRGKSDTGHSDQRRGGSKPGSKSEASASPVASDLLEPPSRPVPAFIGGALSGSPTPSTREAQPPPRCPEHLDTDGSVPCGACGDARRALTRWEAADSERRRNAPKCRRHRGQPADNCGLCRSEELADQETS